MSYDSVFARTVGLEGGLSMDPEDNGNWTGGHKGVGILKGTKYGISAASYPNEDIINLTLDRAKFLYKRDRWDVLRLDEVIDGVIQEKIFDASVLTGVGEAAIIVQKSINFLEPGPEDQPLKVDGGIGPITLSYINKWCRIDPEALFKALNGFEFMRFVEVCRASGKKFDRGWMKRIQSYHAAGS